jgi:hypothetical protein
LALPNIRYGVVMPSWGSPGKSRDVYNICECDDDFDMLFVALDNLVLDCFYPEDHGDLILYKPEFLDGFGPQDLEIKPVTSLSGFAGQDLKPVTERVPVDVMVGGNLSEPTVVTEQYLLNLEREAFLQLCGERKTLERIQFMLQKGKPLRN